MNIKTTRGMNDVLQEANFCQRSDFRVWMLDVDSSARINECLQEMFTVSTKSSGRRNNNSQSI